MSHRRTAGKQIHSNKMCKTNQSVAKRLFYKHFSLIMSSNFRYQNFVAVSGNLGGRVPVFYDVLSSHEQEIYPTTSLDETCKEFEFQTDGNYYVDLRQTHLALKLKIIRGCGYQTHNTKGLKKGTQKRCKYIRGRNGEGRRSSSSRCSCKQQFAFNFFQCRSVHQRATNLQH